MNWVSAREGVGIALDALRSNKVRAGLTILGIVIGVATVMAMASAIAGIRGLVLDQMAAVDPDNFVVARFDMTAIRIDTGGDAPWDDHPPLTLDDAEMLGSLPSVRTVAPAAATQAEVRYEDESFLDIQITGMGPMWASFTQGDFIAGRNYLPSDENRSSTVAVLSSDLATKIFGRENPIGETIRIRGVRFEVVGVYRQKENLFSNLNKEWIYVPVHTAFKHLDAADDWVEIWVVPREDVTQAQAMDQVIAALRTDRGLRPGEDNTFALIRQEQFIEMFNRLTGVFFLVMLVLSSIGLMVGGIGVVAIMMISVTERTREIGVRKALGATKREILWQFLVESTTVTVIGGLIGMALGGTGALLLGALSPLPTSMPLWSIAAALGMSAFCGIGFGLYPAYRAARLDPVDALRYE